MDELSVLHRKGHSASEHSPCASANGSAAKKIKEVLEYDDIGKIIDFLNEAEKRADEKIALLKESKAMIRRARADYERKPRITVSDEYFIEHFPEQVILLSDTLETPTLDNLWNYLEHFYNRVGKDKFEFEDAAGIYTENGRSRLFAVCVKYEQINGLITLPDGDYLCADCSEKEREDKLGELLKIAERKYNAHPRFTAADSRVGNIAVELSDQGFLGRVSCGEFIPTGILSAGYFLYADIILTCF